MDKETYEEFKYRIKHREHKSWEKILFNSPFTVVKTSCLNSKLGAWYGLTDGDKVYWEMMPIGEEKMDNWAKDFVKKARERLTNQPPPQGENGFF